MVCHIMQAAEALPTAAGWKLLNPRSPKPTAILQSSKCMYIYIYTHILMYIYIYIYIQIAHKPTSFGPKFLGRCLFGWAFAPSKLSPAISLSRSLSLSIYIYICLVYYIYIYIYVCLASAGGAQLLPAKQRK